MQTWIERLKILLEIDHDREDERLTVLTQNICQGIMMRVEEEFIPPELEWVLIEATVMRYNRLGSEGYTTEKIDIISTTYIEDILNHFQPYFTLYLNSQRTPIIPTPKVRMF